MFIKTGRVDADLTLNEYMTKYLFCKTFGVSPVEYEKCSVLDIEYMLFIEKSVKEYEASQIEKNGRTNNQSSFSSKYRR